MKSSLVKGLGHIAVLTAVMCGTGSGDEKYQRSIMLLQRHGIDQFTAIKKYVRRNTIRKYCYTLFLERNAFWQIGFKFGRSAYDCGFEAIGDGIPIVLYIYDRGTSERSKQDCTASGKKSLREFCYGHIIPGLFFERAQMLA